MRFEQTSKWPIFIIGVILGLSYYLVYKAPWLINPHKHDDINVCITICKNNSLLTVYVLKKKNYIEATTADYIINTVNTLCESDCYHNIK